MAPETLRQPSDPDQFRVQVGRFGERFYFDPLPGDGTWDALDPQEPPYPSVTTLKKVTARDFSPVAARRVAEYAVDSLHSWKAVAEDNREAAITLLVGADRRGLQKAGERGTAVHGVMENLAAGRDTMLDIDSSALPYVEACKAFLHDMSPTFEYNEVVAINRKYRYGGTLDCILIIGGKRYLVDWKSRKAGGHAAYNEEAWQIAAYAYADYYIVGDEQGLPVRIAPPELDGGLVVSICPGKDSYKVYPVDLDKAWTGFLAMRRLWEASHGDEYKPLGKPIELMPRTYKLDLRPPAAPEVKGAPPLVERALKFADPMSHLSEALAAWDPFEGLPTGDVAGTTHEMMVPAPGLRLGMTNAQVYAETQPDKIAIGPAQYDAFVSTSPLTEKGQSLLAMQDHLNTWVEATWMQAHFDLQGQPLGPPAEQRLQGWLVEVGAERAVLADDAGNKTAIDAKSLKVTPAEHPPAPGVVAIANPLDGHEGLVQPETAPKPPTVAPTATTAPPADADDPGDPEVRAWLRARLEADVAALGGEAAVLKYWPKGIKALDKAGKNPHTVADLEAIEWALMSLERDMQLPFFEPKPGAQPEPEPADGAKVDPLAPFTGKYVDISWGINEGASGVLVACVDGMAQLDWGFGVDITADGFSIKVGEPAESPPPAPKLAHPDDVELVKARAVKASEDWPLTFKVILDKAKDAGVPNLNRGKVTEQHVRDLDEIITTEIGQVEDRKAVISSLLQGVSPDMQVMIPFLVGTQKSMDEPDEEMVTAIQVLTDAAISGKLTISDTAELVASESLIEEARTIYPERVQLFRAVNPYLTGFGMSTVNTLEGLRRSPLGILMLLHTHTNTNS